MSSGLFFFSLFSLFSLFSPPLSPHPLHLPPKKDSPAHQLLRHGVDRVTDRLEVRPLAAQDLPHGLDDRPLFHCSSRDGRQQRRVEEVVARGDHGQVDLCRLGLRQGFDEAHGAPAGAQHDDARARRGGGRGRRVVSVDRVYG